ncbi:uncharacterized protein LOC112452280 [Temnothorax curvispinosus]|uniref:Uncharacterized protein LOC112452280 n=1 Tax=Temnothorax curvispinosus TaxID=300111 RepID=A0A6J1PFJ2_9HYME|nr:uncharacterized protein LOC112452280 [Temnothorax curvispinosus]
MVQHNQRRSAAEYYRLPSYSRSYSNVRIQPESSAQLPVYPHPGTRVHTDPTSHSSDEKLSGTMELSGMTNKIMIHNRRKRSDPASTESSKSKIVAHDNDVTAKSPLTDVKHPTTDPTIESLLESILSKHKPTDTNDKRVENHQTKNNFILSILGFLNSIISSANITLPEHKPTDTTVTVKVKRMENYPSIQELSKYNFILCVAPFRSSTISSRNITFPRDKPTDTNDERVENCQIEKNFILSIFTFLGSTISSTNITLSEHEPTDTNDKRVENCEIKYNFILCIAPFLNSTISSANIGFHQGTIHILPFLGSTLKGKITIGR